MGVCRVRALIPAPLPQVWEFLIKPENMHLWGPPTRPVTGINRPLQAGDRVTQYRRDFFRHYSQVVLVEKAIPYRALHLRDLSKSGSRLNATGIISLEPAQGQEETWIEEAIFYSLGNGRVMQWLDRWLINPILQLVAGYKTNKAFRRLQAIMASSRAPVPS
jgi:ligand-binding SRPBCC domain-containing protein